MAASDFRQAINAALEEELARDESVIFFGEDVARAGGVFQVTKGLWEKFGDDRVFDTPISELALSSAAFGSAVTGSRPIFEIMFADFSALAADSLINQAAKYSYLSDGREIAPLTMRMTVGAGGQFGAIHSQIPIPWFMGVPGLKIVAPATPRDAKALLKASIRDDNPVVFLEHKRLYSSKGEVGDADEVGELGRCALVREGTDVTIVSAMKGVHDSLEAAAALAEKGIEAEVVDLRTLRPLDSETILRSVEKTGRLLVVEEGPRTGGWAGEVLAVVAEGALGHLDEAARLTMPDLPIPYSPPLEAAVLPGPAQIVAAVEERNPALFAVGG
jgi:acetoin:2,6-dichlorophenolindophenol oxidoreductase subunit beta